MEDDIETKKEKYIRISCACNEIKLHEDSGVLRQLFPLYPWVHHMRCQKCNWEVTVYNEIGEQK